MRRRVTIGVDDVMGLIRQRYVSYAEGDIDFLEMRCTDTHLVVELELTPNEPVDNDEPRVPCHNCGGGIAGKPNKLYARSDTDEMLWVCEMCVDDMRSLGVELREVEAP